MKVSELWLHEWVNPDLTRAQLSNQLTMAGLEVEELTPVALEFTNVVIGKIVNVQPHPSADNLTICELDVGTKDHLTIVCGAKNCKVGKNVPVALPNAVL